MLKNSVFGSDRQNFSLYRASSSWRRGGRLNWLSVALAPADRASRTVSSDFLLLWAFAEKLRCLNFGVFQHNQLIADLDHFQIS